VQQVQHEKRLSQRRVCQALGFDRSSMRYMHNLAKEHSDQALVQELRLLAQKHPSLGYRKITVLLKRQGQEPIPSGCSACGSSWA
jgi:hypothetical protein